MTKQPEWQRGLIKHSCIPELVGREVWVKGRPADRLSQDFGTHRIHICRVFLSNLTYNLPGTDGTVTMGPEGIELLARDENDFADDVPMIPLEEFRRSS